MNRKLLWAPLAGLLAFSSGMAAADRVPDREAYAYRFPLAIEQAAEFMAADIPLEVYRSVTDSHLRDCGVYNAEGQAVPRVFEQPKGAPESVEHATGLGLVPLYGELGKAPEQLRFLMQQGAAGTTLKLDAQAPRESAPQAEQSLRAYIVDLREQNTALAALEFDWTGSPSGFIGAVTIEDGSDLLAWRRLAGGTLADLEYEGTRIEQNRIELPRKADGYLRVTWRDMPRDWRLAGISGIRRERGPEHDRDWLELAAIGQSEDGREFTFDIGGFPPVDRVNLLLPGDNVVVRVSVQYRHGEEDHWRLAHEGVFYHVSRGGNDIASAAAPLGPTRAGQWKVNIHSGLAGGTVRLRLGWRPERLLFLAQGSPPFELATGRARDRLERFPQDELLGDRSIFTMLKSSGEAGRATLGARRTGAGAMVMEGARTWTWRTVLVWIGLFAAVLFVGWLVWSLMRDMKRGEKKGADG